MVVNYAKPEWFSIVDIEQTPTKKMSDFLTIQL